MGDGTYATSHSTGSDNGSVAVNRIQSSISVGCAPESVEVGSSAVCTATVTGYMPMGLVSFSNSGTAHVSVPGCSLSMVTQATSSCETTASAVGAGSSSIQASYPGDINNIPPTPSQGAPLSVIRTTSIASVNCFPSTVTAGQMAACTATVKGYVPSGSIIWSSTDTAGIFNINPCTLDSGSCEVGYTATSSAQITASYAGDGNNTGSQASFSITVNVQETIQITVANSGPTTDVTLSGCSVSPTTIPTAGTPIAFTASSGCTGIVATLPPAGSDTRYLTALGQGSLPIPACSSSSCAAFSATIYYQLLNTYQVAPASPSSWSASGTITVTGTIRGVADQSLCIVTVSTGAGQFSCQGWSDYETQTTMGVLPIPLDQQERWATGQSSFIDTSGGNQHTSTYYSQDLENFTYTLVGSTTAPSAPDLNYTGFGTNSTYPLTGKQSLVWLDSGSSWSAPAALAGSSSTERWESSITSGAATAGQTVALTYYHQFLITFGYSVVGGGTAYSSPTFQFTSFGAPSQGSQGWVDAGTAYSFTNPLGGSTSSERWLTPTPTAVASASGPANAVYFHQYAFVLTFTVSGGGTYDSPVLNFTALGRPGLAQVNATNTTFWIDSSAKWGVSALLPNSSPTERWVTKQTSSGTALAPFVDDLLYYHQYLGAFRYSILGAGGSPPVPNLNYSSLGAAILVPLVNGTARTYWIDSGSFWVPSSTVPGIRGERWLSNVTGPIVADTPLVEDVQYAHQFYVEVGVSTPAGGQVANTNQWETQMSTVILNATAAQAWNFAYWQGATAFSYNGTTRLPTLSVLGPANETAIFFPGLTIITTSQGAVGYSYGTISGTVPPASTATIYPPPGRNVTLTAMPVTVSVKFNGWTGQVVGTQLPSELAYSLQAPISIESPAVVHATFSTDYTDIRTFAIASLGIFAAACFVFIVRRGYTPKLEK
ncbi:MAG: hypothetical protein OK442_03275 [Thaumarchaeota archaeon]|nr:hypothetical protein [Nitrososphaerota archaeon]